MNTKQSFSCAEDVRRVAELMESYYLTDEAMRFFNSRLLPDFYPLNPERTEGFIIVSNKDDFVQDSARTYNVARVTQNRRDNGSIYMDIRTVGTFDTPQRAKKIIQALIDNLRTV